MKLQIKNGVLIIVFHLISFLKHFISKTISELYNFYCTFVAWNQSSEQMKHPPKKIISKFLIFS